jgi:hypothetical protein
LDEPKLSLRARTLRARRKHGPARDLATAFLAIHSWSEHCPLTAS